MSAPNYFGTLAEEWSSYYRHKPPYRERLDVLLSMIPAELAARGGRVLDLGCGTGDVSLPLAAAGCRVTGMDASPGMLAVARRRAESLAKGRARYLLADAGALPLRDGAFDAVLASSVLEYVESPARCFGEMFRVLTPGGVAVFSVPNSRSLYRMAERAAARLLRPAMNGNGAPGPLRRLSYVHHQRQRLSFAEWRDAAREAGFVLEASRCFGSPRPVYWAGRRAAALLTSSPRWGTLLACLARKS